MHIEVLCTNCDKGTKSDTVTKKPCKVTLITPMLPKCCTRPSSVTSSPMPETKIVSCCISISPRVRSLNPPPPRSGPEIRITLCQYNHVLSTVIFNVIYRILNMLVSLNFKHIWQVLFLQHFHVITNVVHYSFNYL